MVSEARLEQTEAGLVPASEGWFVMNARDARWIEQPGRGWSLPLTGVDEYEAETFFAMLGMAIRVLEPGKPSDTYHWETEQEDFLVLHGKAILIVEGQERGLSQWGWYCADETAARYNASPPEDTQDNSLAYGRFEQRRPARYRDGLLPDS